MANLSKEKGQELFPQWVFIGFICIGIQGVYVKLINHCQAVMIKQYITFKELSGLILSQDQLAKGL